MDIFNVITIIITIVVIVFIAMMWVDDRLVKSRRVREWVTV